MYKTINKPENNVRIFYYISVTQLHVGLNKMKLKCKKVMFRVTLLLLLQIYFTTMITKKIRSIDN